jgi:hypothetical protein
MNHKDKKAMAVKMLTKEERKNHTPVFLSSAWNKRKMDRVYHIQKQEYNSKVRKMNKKGVSK